MVIGEVIIIIESIDIMWLIDIEDIEVIREWVW